MYKWILLLSVLLHLLQLWHAYYFGYYELFISWVVIPTIGIYLRILRDAALLFLILWRLFHIFMFLFFGPLVVYRYLYGHVPAWFHRMLEWE